MFSFFFRSRPSKKTKNENSWDSIKFNQSDLKNYEPLPKKLEDLDQSYGELIKKLSTR